MRCVLLFVLVAALTPAAAQEPLSARDALATLYPGYDAANGTAPWHCAAEQRAGKAHPGWECTPDYATVSITVLLSAQVPEGGEMKTYLVTSAKPTGPDAGYGCHGCAPAIGAALFAFDGKDWAAEGANPAIGFYGGWGAPPEVSLVQVGPERHGIVLSWTDMGQGFIGASKSLLIPTGKTVCDVWDLDDEEDDLGAIDPSDKMNNLRPHRSSAAFRFLSGDETTNSNGNPDYYDIEVIARGDNHDDWGKPSRSQNWTAIYRFSNGKYRLLKRMQFTEAPAKK